MAGNSLSPNLDLEYVQALRAAIDVVNRQLKDQGVKTSLITRRKIIELAREHLAQQRRATARFGRATLKQGQTVLRSGRFYSPR
jgi:hypothetical protein